MKEPNLVHLAVIVEALDLEKIARHNHTSPSPQGYLVSLRFVDRQLHVYPAEPELLDQETQFLLEQRKKLEAEISNLQRQAEALRATNAAQVARTQVFVRSPAPQAKGLFH